MSPLSKWLSALVVTLILFGATATPSRAWWWETTYTVKAQGTYSSPYYQALSCRSATLVAGGRSYTGSVSTNWFAWNGCNVQFNGIPVRSGWAQLTVTGTAMFRTVRGTAWVYIGGPNNFGSNTLNLGNIAMS
jgi:hypothetical protein